MTDLLGSILGSMEKPPVIEDKEKKRAREQKALLEKQQQQEKQKLSQFRVQVQKRIADFVKDSTLQKQKFEEMNKVQRAVVFQSMAAINQIHCAAKFQGESVQTPNRHEVADVAGLTSFSFGEEEVDRHIVVWKKEFAPCDEELVALRNNQEWDPEKARLQAAEKEEESKRMHSKRKHQEPLPPADYHRKYEHLLGKESAKDAARVTSANKSYGFVPSENKRDQRTIEQVMADSRARKRQKLEDEASEPSSSTTSDQPE